MRAVVAAMVCAALVALPLPAYAAGTDCVVAGAQLSWGFKESFRSYISGTIANGEWTVADGATYQTPVFGWHDGAGSYDDGEGTVGFDGSITFTGHGGILNTTVANPVVRFDGDRALLLLDVTGTTQEGEAIDERGVEFAELDLSHGALAEGQGRVDITEAPATLTADGAHAFGTYQAGEGLDPVTLSFTTGKDCTDARPPLWFIPAGTGVIVVAAAAVTFVVLRRRRSS